MIRKLACIALITALTINTEAGKGSILDRAKVIGEYRQDEVEQLMENFVSSAYGASSESGAKRAAGEMQEIMTTDEVSNLSSEIGYNSNGYDIQEVKVYYVSKANSYDGRTKEYMDLKVGNKDVNYMYLIEFTVNDESKIFTHTIWRH